VAQHLSERRHGDGAHRSRVHHAEIITIEGESYPAARGRGNAEVGANGFVQLTDGGRSKIPRFLMSANSERIVDTTSQ